MPEECVLSTCCVCWECCRFVPSSRSHETKTLTVIFYVECCIVVASRLHDASFPLESPRTVNTSVSTVRGLSLITTTPLPTGKRTTTILLILCWVECCIVESFRSHDASSPLLFFTWSVASLLRLVYTMHLFHHNKTKTRPPLRRVDVTMQRRLPTHTPHARVADAARRLYHDNSIQSLLLMAGCVVISDMVDLVCAVD